MSADRSHRDARHASSGPAWARTSRALRDG